jgi:integrase
MAVTARDKHGTVTKARRARQQDTKPVDRATLRYHAVVDNVWSKAFATKPEAAAEDERLKQSHRARRGAGATLASSNLTVAEFLRDVWLANVDAKVARQQIKGTTRAHYGIVVDRYIVPAIGTIRLRDLQPAHVRRLYADLSGRGLAPKTVRNVHVLLSNALALAFSDGYVTRNVAKARDVAPTARSREMSVWNADQLRAFLTHVADDPLFAAWRLVAMGGLRRGEALALRWSDVDLDRGQLTIARSLVVSPDDKSLVWQTPKSERSRRTIDVDPATVDALRHRRKTEDEVRRGALGAWQDDDLVFTDGIGRPIRPATFSSRFDALVKKSGLPRIRLHDLRHTAATLLLQAGVPVHVVSDRLGHATPSTTMNIYAHVLRDQRSDAATRLAAAIDGG